MKKLTGILMATFLVTTLTLVSMGEADAKRMGGGRSFGSRPSYSEPYRAPGGMNPAAPSQAQPAYQAPQRSPAAPAMPGQSPRRSGLMGMLGGLAIGGLLGSLLFGHAFEGIKLLDILLFAGVAFLLFKLLAARRAPAPGPVASAEGPGAYGRSAVDDPAQRRPSSVPAGFDTDVLFGGGRKAGTPAGFANGQQPAFPADFDQAGFLTGAKAAYVHMQQAWDNGDLTELRSLTTDKVFGDLQEQLRQREGTSRTELVAVDARILEVRDSGTEREASVLFDVMMREDGGPAESVKEVWHFVRPHASKQPTWYLDGIQQWED